MSAEQEYTAQNHTCNPHNDRHRQVRDAVRLEVIKGAVHGTARFFANAFWEHAPQLVQIGRAVLGSILRAFDIDFD